MEDEKQISEDSQSENSQENESEEEKKIIEKPEVPKKQESFQEFLDSHSINTNIKKSVAKNALVYPTILQSRLIPLLLQGQKHVLVKYESQSGIKLGLFIPVLNKVLEKSTDKITTIVLIHNKKRMAEISDFLNDIITFCKDSVTIKTLTKSDDELANLPDILLCNPKTLNSILPKLDKNKAFSLIIDQLDLHLQMDFKEELKNIGLHFSTQGNLHQIIMTVKTTEDTDAQIQEIKKCFMEAALVVRFKAAAPMLEEKLIHYFYDCEGNEENKYLLLFAMLKLNVIYGKTVIKADNIKEGYKLKIFLGRIGIAAQFLNPEMPANTQKNILQSFGLGHFDYMIILGNEKGLKLKNVRNAIFFTMAANYGEYSKIVNQISFEDGYIISLIGKPEENEILSRLEEKQKEHLGGVLFTELPVKKHILAKYSYRVSDALKSITPKTIKAEKSKELKRQLIGSKKLKKYFEEHPTEKEILVKELGKNKDPDYRFADLKILPDYLIPNEPLLANPIEEAIVETKGLVYAEKDTSKLFPEENPDIMNYEQLPPTSGRKRWKIRHHRSLKKKVSKKDKPFTPE